ncbi:unnamed protein product, partial [Porites evermanni]
LISIQFRPFNQDTLTTDRNHDIIHILTKARLRQFSCCLNSPYLKLNKTGNPNIATVTKARCYANCLTENPAINETGIPCQTSACKKCLGPCESSY